MMSDMLVQYMQLASSGAISFDNVFTLMGLQLPVLAINLLPLAFYLALLFALSRMYLNSEMVVLRSGGYSVLRSYFYIFTIAIGVALLELALCWSSLPTLEAKQMQEMAMFQNNLSFSKVIPRNFQAYSDQGIFYVDKVINGSPLNIYFFKEGEGDDANANANSFSVMHAAAAHMESRGYGRYLVFDKGVRQNGIIGNLKSTEMHFANYGLLLMHYNPNDIPIKFQPSRALWFLQETDNIAKAQLQWRLSLPLSILILTGFACVLSPLKPRSNQHGAILMGVLVYAIYMNLLLWVKSFMQKSSAVAINAWWIHAAMLALLVVFWLYRRRKNLLN
jgi:lipopolysaccharide export system permease protein